MNKSSVENFYRNMNLSDLLQVVCKDIKSFLSDNFNLRLDMNIASAIGLSL